MSKNTLQKNKGFTLLELVIILIMLALVGAMFLPKIKRAHNYNIRIANQTNIRAAMDAAKKDFMSGGFDTKYTKNNKDDVQYFNYYRYNTSTKKIDRLSMTKREDGIPLGIEAAEQAKANKICSFIMVYAGYGSKGELELMTAPFYREDGKIYYGNNPYGQSLGTE